MRDEKSLAHTRWNCKYHIVFAPKYRRQVFYREKTQSDWQYFKKTVRMEKREYPGSRMLCGSHPYASGDPAQDECLGIYGVPEGKEQSDAL
ncbi:transposase IS200 like family protein [Yersinia pestis 1045]|nr:transposase IS200 like family protein [Yersinia pestis 1045]